MRNVIMTTTRIFVKIARESMTWLSQLKTLTLILIVVSSRKSMVSHQDLSLREILESKMFYSWNLLPLQIMRRSINYKDSLTRLLNVKLRQNTYQMLRS